MLAQSWLCYDPQSWTPEVFIEQAIDATTVTGERGNALNVYKCALTCP